MNKLITLFFSASAIAVVAASSPAHAEAGMTDSGWVGTAPSSGKTRAQVEAELAAAQRAGELSFGQEDLTQRELHPSWYPGGEVASAVVSSGGATRDQELASLTAAAKAGEISTNEVVMIMRELYPAPSSDAAATGGIATTTSSTPAN